MTCPFFKTENEVCDPVISHFSEEAILSQKRGLFIWHYEEGYCTRLDILRNPKCFSCACFLEFQSKHPEMKIVVTINPSRRDSSKVA